MQLLPSSCAAAQLSLLVLLLIPLNILGAALGYPHNIYTAASLISIRDDEHRVLPSTQPFSTQPINNISFANTTIPIPPLYIFRFLDLHAIFTSPQTEKNILKAMERTCEAFAYYLLDLDLLEEQNFVLHFGDFTLDFYDVGEHLSMLAVKAVGMRLLQMITKGLWGFVKGEVVDVQAGVRMIFTFGVLGGWYENWGLRKRRIGERRMTHVSNG